MKDRLLPAPKTSHAIEQTATKDKGEGYANSIDAGSMLAFGAIELRIPRIGATVSMCT